MHTSRWAGARPALLALLEGLALALALSASLAAADVSRPGGAGHALLFRDHGVVIENFKDLAPDALTFEAWLSTTDYCHRSAIFSYAIQSQSTDPLQRIADFNHFVIFDPSNLVGCHDFTYIDLWPDPAGESCYAAYNRSSALPSFVERDGKWHHLAVVWTAANNGLTQIYWDGLLIVSTPSGKTRPLQPGGALMLGAEQDCYGGCTDRGQGFFGLMDEVRIWRTARTQSQILESMRAAGGLDNHPDLAAYWQFNDPEQNGVYRETLTARDASGRGNHLHLVTLPAASTQTIERGSQRFESGALTFRNNYAMQQAYQGMPDRDITFFSFASFARDEASLASTVFLDDSILIEKYMEEFSGSHWLDYERLSTRGSISVHINANREGNGKRYDHWIDFAVGWLDNQWHHVAVTWSWESGEVKLYFDGEPRVPFWSSRAGVVHPDRGGVDPHIAARTARSSNGSLVLGQAHDCPGGCFSPQYSLHGDMANLRVWNRVLSREEVAAGMFAVEPPNKQGLAAHYPFRPDTLEQMPDGRARLRDVHSGGVNPLMLGADAPLWVYSTAPLATPDGSPVQPPTAGSGGYAMFLSDQQVLIAKNMTMPPDEITVELWMRSTDTCRMGVPFSYAAPGSDYAKNDNAFLLFNYNSFGVAVMEDEGGLADHLSGISATDGRWHHIAVTWRSSDGQTKLYDNGVEVWSVVRGQGARITSGGTLVVGREQDCEGGCFDSEIGAAGSVQEDWEQEYGAQDFFGTIDELRVWRKARTQEQIQQGMAGNLFRKGATGQPAGPGVDPRDPDLVAYWNFDEGKGWRVHDVTGHGHDLFAAEEPRWEVVRHLAACGNGVLEGLEECDDGNTQPGDGCDATCKVESGWHCTRTSPSICAHSGERLPDVPAEPQGGPDTPAPGGGGAGPTGGDNGGRRSGKGWLIAGLVLAGVTMACMAAFMGREQIYDRFPQVEAAVATVASRLPGRRHRYSGLPYDEFADPGLQGTPAGDFTATSPAPDRRGAATFLGYQALPAAAPPAPPQEQP
ncbi:hypothetical protein ABPG77_001352 [Micractinium sp. CCAP 211/92]